MVELLHGWGAELSPDDFAKAVAAVGVIEAFGTGGEGERDAALLRKLLTYNLGRNDIYWHDSHNYFIDFEPDYWRKKYPDPEALARTWDAIIQQRTEQSGELRIAIPLWSEGAPSVRWHQEDDLYKTLAAKSLGLDALLWGRRPRGPTRRSWRFPLRVGITGEDEMREMRRLIEQTESHYARLFRYAVLGEDADHCDLLLTTSHPDALAERKFGNASVIVFLRPIPDHLERRSLFDRLNGAISSAAIAFAGTPVHDLPAVQSILTRLTHDESLDVAIWNSVRIDADLWATSGEPALPVIIGDPQFLRGTGLTRTIERSALEYEYAGLEDTAAWMRNIAAQHGFLGESDGASEFVKKLEDTKSQLNSRRLTRWIHAAPHDRRDSDIYREYELRFNRRERIAPILQGRWNFIKVWIGPEERDADGVAFREPSIGDFDQVNLQVLLKVDDAAVTGLYPYPHFEALQQLRSPPPNLQENRDAMRVALTEVSLPRIGTSGFGWFAVWVAQGQAEVHGQLVILFENRAIQNARVTITAVPETSSGAEHSLPDQPSSESDEGAEKVEEGSRGSVKVHPDSPIRSRTDDVIDMSRFDATLLASGKDEKLELITVRGAEAKIRLPNLTKTIWGIQAKLEELTQMKEARIDLSAGWLRDLLWICAGHGIELRRYFQKQLGSDLLHCQRVQLISRDQAYLPIEFTYDGEPPSNQALMCEHAPKALDRGDCGDCPNRKSEDHICPMHFWGLKKVIERHAESANPEDGVDFVVRRATPTERMLTPRQLLHAESNRAYSFPGAPTQTEFQKSLAAMVSHTPIEVRTWQEWRDVVETRKPNVLFLVPHIECRNGLDYLEIGASDPLRKFQIKRAYIGLTDDEPQLVLLLGCRGAQPNQDFATFAAVFREEGADLVLTTLSGIRGQDALPIAEEIARFLGKPSALPKMGGWMMALRRRLLLDGLPVGLGLVAYGDADWRIGGAP
jgi:hypothetical protein